MLPNAVSSVAWQHSLDYGVVHIGSTVSTLYISGVAVVALFVKPMCEKSKSVLVLGGLATASAVHVQEERCN